MDCLKAALATLNEATSGVVIGDCMLLHPVKIHPEDDLFTAIKAIIDNRVSGLCVVDERENLLGVLSEMDCLRAILSAIYNDHREVGRVSEHMTTDVESCDAGADMIAVASRHAQQGPQAQTGARRGSSDRADHLPADALWAVPTIAPTATRCSNT